MQKNQSVSHNTLACSVEKQPRQPLVHTPMRFTWLLLLLAWCALFSSACAGSTDTPQAQSTPTTAASPTVAMTPANTVLYQSDWSKGLSAWKASKNVKIVNNVVQTTANGITELTIPYTPTGSDYAVEFRLHVVSIPKSGGYYRLEALPGSGKNGYVAEINNLLAGDSHLFAIHPASQILINPLAAMDSPQEIYDFEPGKEWRDYRVQVSGARATFFVDGVKVSTARSGQTSTLSNGPLHFKSEGAALQLNNFRVMTL